MFVRELIHITEKLVKKSTGKKILKLSLLQSVPRCLIDIVYQYHCVPGFIPIDWSKCLVANNDR